ncbi:MAG: hypothetical protein IIB60_03175 [Planctomycetes bacterium]|nr:hypothetical protein [Planctomycetota bacterium]
MALALAPPIRPDCDYVRPDAWRAPRAEVDARGWCGHGVDESEGFARTEQPRCFPRKRNPATPAPSPLDKIIEASRAILELELDEDEAQAPYAEETWTRAVDFLRRNTKWVWDTFSRVVDLPEILPGPDGSIDLHWDYPRYEMLINIPADPANKAGFYGDDRGENHIKGSFDPRTHDYGPFLWLATTK